MLKVVSSCFKTEENNESKMECILKEIATPINNESNDKMKVEWQVKCDNKTAEMLELKNNNTNSVRFNLKYKVILTNDKKDECKENNEGQWLDLCENNNKNIKKCVKKDMRDGIILEYETMIDSKCILQKISNIKNDCKIECAMFVDCENYMCNLNLSFVSNVVSLKFNPNTVIINVPKNSITNNGATV